MVVDATGVSINSRGLFVTTTQTHGHGRAPTYNMYDKAREQLSRFWPFPPSVQL